MIESKRLNICDLCTRRIEKNERKTSPNKARWGLALGDHNTLYIADSNNQRVQTYLPGVSFGLIMAGYANGTRYQSLQCLNFLEGIDRDQSENLYIVDTANHRVPFWTNGASSGKTE
jgi:hypothetical protein